MNWRGGACGRSCRHGVRTVASLDVPKTQMRPDPRITMNRKMILATGELRRQHYGPFRLRPWACRGSRAPSRAAPDQKARRSAARPVEHDAVMLVDRQWWRDYLDAATVGKTRIADRASLVDDRCWRPTQRSRCRNRSPAQARCSAPKNVATGARCAGLSPANPHFSPCHQRLRGFGRNLPSRLRWIC